MTPLQETQAVLAAVLAAPIAAQPYFREYSIPQLDGALKAAAYLLAHANYEPPASR